MSKSKLPRPLIEKIKELFHRGHTDEEIFKLVIDEARHHVDSHDELSRCISAIKGAVGSKMIRRSPKRQTRSPIPKPKDFDDARYREIIDQLHERMPGKELEDQCTGIAKDILTNYEGFERVEKGPELWGTPFDFFGFKNGAPYMIELKASLNSFNSTGETQKWRMQELLGRVKGLNIALLQIPSTVMFPVLE